MTLSNRIKSLTLSFSLTAFISWQALAAGVPNEFPRTTGTVARETNDSAAVVFDDVKPAANEFPTTVGTINQDSGGFEVTWDETSLSNLLSKLDIFGLFSSDDKTETKSNTQPKLQTATNVHHTQPITLAQNNTQADTKKSNEPETMEKNLPVSTPEQPTKSSNFSKEAPKKVPAKERQDASSLIFSKDNKAHKDKKVVSEPTTQVTEDLTDAKVAEVAEIDAVEVIDDHGNTNTAVNEQTNNTVIAQEEDHDWRKDRQWWQRGSPVL